MEPLVSIGIPTYNAESFLKETIQSALAQTHKNIEVIVVDDCSQDTTLEILREIQDSRLRVHINDVNQGPSVTWNKTLELAQGEYFKLLCHDDVLYPDCIQEQLQGFSDSSVVMVASNRDVLDAEGSQITCLRNIKRTRIEDGLSFFRSCLRRGGNLIGEPHAVLVKIGPLREHQVRFGKDFFVIDIDFYAKCLAIGKVSLIDKTLSAFRVSDESASVKLASKQLSLLKRFVTELRADKKFKISYFDHLCFIVTATSRNILKLVFYKLFVR
ncbi:MAG: glycosyltransferase family 2 protein [Pseudomonadales bacterium]